METLTADNLVPLGDTIIVKRNSSEMVTPGGIVIPDTAQEKARRGRVLAVGQGNTDKEGKRIPTSLKEGDEILFSKYSGEDMLLQLGGEEVLIMSIQEVLGKIE